MLASEKVGEEKFVSIIAVGSWLRDSDDNGERAGFVEFIATAGVEGAVRYCASLDVVVLDAVVDDGDLAASSLLPSRSICDEETDEYV